MTLPNFLIIGAAKCGTTSLYYYLQQHPQVFMSVPKEPTFFGNEGTDGLFNGPHDEDRAYHSRVITKFSDYTAMFDRVKEEKAIGEASIYYLYLPKAPEQINKYVPRASMFAVLRNPVDRAYSAYLHVVRQAREGLSFARALEEEPERIRQNWNPVWHFKTMGFYYSQVKRYYDMFGRDQVRVYLYEELQKEPLRLIQEILEIVGLTGPFTPDMSRRYKRSYVPRISSIEMALHQTKYKIELSKPHLPERLRWRMHHVKDFVDRVADFNRTAAPPMPEQIRLSLMADYREDILKLGDLLRRDLSAWLTPVAVGAVSGE